MREYIELGSVPAEEPCVSVTPDGDYFDAMRAECFRYKKLLEKKFADAPNGVYFTVKWFSHDFGRYAEVVVNYDEDDEECVTYAYHVEKNLPAKWTDDAPEPYHEPVPEHPMEFYLEHLKIGPVYRINNIWGLYDFLDEHGNWEYMNMKYVSPEYSLFMDEKGLQYFDTSREYCRKG